MYTPDLRRKLPFGHVLDVRKRAFGRRVQEYSIYIMNRGLILLSIRKILQLAWAVKDVIDGFPHLRKMRDGVVKIVNIFR